MRKGVNADFISKIDVQMRISFIIIVVTINETKKYYTRL